MKSVWTWLSRRFASKTEIFESLSSAARKRRQERNPASSLHAVTVPLRDKGYGLVLLSMFCFVLVAAFLLNLVQRLHARGFSQSELVLRMTREEIGSYLGLKLETVSRTFSKFVEEGIVEVKQRHVRILSTEALQRLVNHPNAACH